MVSDNCVLARSAFSPPVGGRVIKWFYGSCWANPNLILYFIHIFKKVIQKYGDNEIFSKESFQVLKTKYNWVFIFPTPIIKWIETLCGSVLVGYSAFILPKVFWEFVAFDDTVNVIFFLVFSNRLLLTTYGVNCMFLFVLDHTLYFK